VVGGGWSFIDESRAPTPCFISTRAFESQSAL